MTNSFRGHRAINSLKNWHGNIVGAAKRTREPLTNSHFVVASCFQLMRYANVVDCCMLTVGIASSIIVGGALPFNEFMFAYLTEALIAAERDYYNEKLDLNTFLPSIIVYLGCYIAGTVSMLLCGFVSVLCFHALCERQVHIIRCRLFRAIIRQSAAWFDQTEVGALTQKMNAGIEQMQAGLGDKCAFILQGVTSVIVGTVFAFWTSWRLTLVILIAAPLVLYTLYAANAASEQGARNEMGVYAAAGAVANEVLGAIRTVTAFNAQHFEMNRYGITLLFDYDKPLIKPGMLFGVFWMLMLGMIRLGEAIPHLGTISAARLAASEILAIIDESESATKKKSLCRGLKPASIEGRIELENIRFSYPTRLDIDVLDGLSLTVEPGESVALVGASGCGKSTIVSLLLRFYAPSGGSIRIDGTPIELLDVEWLRTSAIGVVAQEPVIFAATIEENMRLGKMDAKMEEIEDSCRQANAHDFIVKLPNGYQTLIGTGGVRLSGGQRQRLAIARALLRQPRILLLDEATSALDGESERLVQAALDRARNGRSMLTIAHRLSTIRNADRIIVLERCGHIVESGTHDELMARSGGVYRQMAAVQHLDASSSHMDDKSMDDIFTKELSEAIINDAAELLPNEEEEETEDSNFTTKLTLTAEELGGNRSVSKAAQLPLPIPTTLQKRKRSSFLTALRYMRRAEVSLAIVAVLFAVVMGAAWPLFSIIYGRMFVVLSAAGGRSAVTVAIQENALFFIALGAMTTISIFASGSLLSYVGETLLMRLRMTVFKNLLRQDSAFYDDSRHSVGKLTARLAVDARNVQAAVDQRLAGAIGALTSLMMGISFAFYFGWSLASGGMVTIIIIFIVELIVMHMLKRRGTVDVAVAEHSANIACEAFENVRTVQALVREDHLCEIFTAASKRNRQRNLFRGFLQSILYGLNYAFVQIIFSVTYFLGIMMVVRMVISPYIVFQVTESLIAAAFAVMRFAAYLPEYLRARLSATQMTTMIRRCTQIDALGEDGSAKPIRGELEVQDVRFAYPTRHQHAVLDGLSFRATSGSTVALVGQSGCGKTTLIQLLERFYDVGGGSIRIDGVDIREYNVSHLRDAIALVNQEPTLFNLSIRDNIAYGMREDVDETRIIEAARMANIDEFVQRLPMKYDTLVGGKGAQLSGGQRQRIAIARAIARQPRILLLDEATSALDANSEKAVQEAMDTARVGRTCVVIAHRLSTIRNADLIVVMDSGRVAESGTHAELMSRGGHYARLVAAGSSVTDAAV